MRVSSRMNCLLCQYENNQKEELREHYIKYHNVDENNLFFKKLIDQKNNTIYRKLCKYCGKFVFSNKVNHDFLKHYGKGLSIDFDSGDLDKRINITNAAGIKR